MSAKKGGLGRGLEAIFMDNEMQENHSPIRVKITEIQPNRDQPRRDFDEESLTGLAESITQHGILQPLLVRPLLEGGYQIVAGERRYRASRMAGLMEVPVVVRELDDAQVMELALIENLQREDLSPLEEAKGYKTLIDSYHFTQEDVAKSVGKSRPAISNTLRLLTLPEQIQEQLERGDIDAGHARTLLAVEDEKEMLKMAEQVGKQGLSVRELEKMVKKWKVDHGQSLFVKGKRETVRRASFYDEIEIALRQELGRKVVVTGGEKNCGSLTIEFHTMQDLADLANRLADRRS